MQGLKSPVHLVLAVLALMAAVTSSHETHETDEVMFNSVDFADVAIPQAALVPPTRAAPTRAAGASRPPALETGHVVIALLIVAAVMPRASKRPVPKDTAAAPTVRCTAVVCDARGVACDESVQGEAADVALQVLLRRSTVASAFVIGPAVVRAR